MSTKTLMSVEEYRHASFDGPDCEYLDGEIVERNVGELPHGKIQGNLIRLFWQHYPRLGLLVVPEIRIQIHSTRFRVADIAVWRDENVGSPIPVVPPFLAIEILSPEDRMVRMAPKVQEYLSIGVEWVWVVDPEEKSALIYSRQNPGGSLAEVLTTRNPEIQIPLARVFDLNA